MTSSISKSPKPTSNSKPDPQPLITSPAASSSSNRWILRSCYVCSKKKTRCDKKEPCTSCARNGKSCGYPPMGPRKRRTKKTIITDMASRLANLEKSAVNSVVHPSGSTDAFLQESEINRSNHPKSLGTKDVGREEVLVQKGSSSQYFNEIFMSRVIGKEGNIKSILTPPETLDQPQLSPFNALGILSSPSTSIELASLHPSTHIAARLWTIYRENVDGGTASKLLHVPTDELKVYSTIDNPQQASHENLALNFAIYFASTVSIQRNEAETILGLDQHTSLLQFKIGLEQALAQGNFLDCPTITGLVALSIYLSALRVHNHGKGIWILNGLAIRLAQSIGLHRDGDRLGISPFQSEMRRRLWWHLLGKEGRAGEDYGLENPNSQLLSSEVGLPANVNDADLFPDMQKPATPKSGWTEMTFTLINIDISTSMQKLETIAASRSTPLAEKSREKIINDTRLRIEKYLANCNPVIPHQLLTLKCSRFLIRKLDFVTKLQWMILRHDSPEAFTTEQNLIEALEILEPRLHNEDGLLNQFSWARKAYPQYHVTMYVLWHLCAKPQSPNATRAWIAVERLFSDELKDVSMLGFGCKSAVLVALKVKAELAREKLGMEKVGTTEDTHIDYTFEAEFGDTRTEGENMGISASSISGDQIDGLGFDDFTNEWPDWTTLVQGFQFDSINNV